MTDKQQTTNDKRATRCVFFDRDGIVNEPPTKRYIERWEEFHLLPGFVTALRLVQEKGYAAIVVTNQRGVSRGVLSLDALNDMHDRFQACLRDEHGLTLLDLIYCIHGDEAHCNCRKPKPGMLLAAAKKHQIDLAASWMIGDKETDVAAGKAAGCRTILVAPLTQSTQADAHVENMSALESFLADTL